MRKHSINMRLGNSDSAVILPPAGHQATDIHFLNNQLAADDRITHESIFSELKRLKLRPSDLAIDLLVLAATVYSADTRVSRTEDSQDGWTREIHLNVPVSQPDLWGGQSELLANTLGFLTGDRWQLSFRARPNDLSDPRIPEPTEIGQDQGQKVCLFSGGLDSFIGAVDLLSSDITPLLVGHYKSGDVSVPQHGAANYLRNRFTEKPPHSASFYINPPKRLFAGADEKTERGRSFLFLSLAVMCATAIGNDVELTVPENGLISLNVPLTPLRVGASSTRTTHPFFLNNYQLLLNQLGIHVTLDNPYQFKTKGEMIRDCLEGGVLQGFMFETMSCAHPSSGRWSGYKRQHCGHCVPCIIRRAAVEMALGNDKTPYSLDIKSRDLDPTKSEGSQVQAFKMALARITKEPNLAEFLIYKSGPMPKDAGFISNAADLYQRGMQEIAALIDQVTIGR